MPQVRVYEYVSQRTWRCEYLFLLRILGQPAACAFVSAEGTYSGVHGSAGVERAHPGAATYVWFRFHCDGHPYEQLQGSFVTLQPHRGQLVGNDHDERRVTCRLVFEGSFMDMPHYDRFIGLFVDQMRRTLRWGRQLAIEQEFEDFVWV